MASDKNLKELVYFTEQMFCKICEQGGWNKDEALFAIMSGVVLGDIDIWELLNMEKEEPEYIIKHI